METTNRGSDRSAERGHTHGPARTLIASLGIIDATRVAVRVTRLALTERPFASLPRATSSRQRKSRRQALPAVLLYRALVAVVGPEQGLQVAQQVIVSGGVAFLSKTLGDLDVSAVLAMSTSERNARVAGWLDRFFTATAELDRSAPPEQAAFIVTRCELVHLVGVAGHPELASAFCASDDAFFRSRKPAVSLDRPTTIARGDDVCRFRFSVLGDD